MKTTTFKKGALFSSVAMLLVAVIALTTASFAWFTASVNPTMTDFNITASSANALLISAKPDTGFLTHLDYADLKKVASNILPEKDAVANRMLNAATPTTGATSGALDATTLSFMAAKEGTKFAGAYDTTSSNADYLAVAANTATITDEATDTIRFIKFDVYFKSTVSEAGSMKVYLDNTTTKDTKIDVTTNSQTAAISYDGSSFVHSYENLKTPALGTAQREIAKVLRVAFVSQLLDASGNVTGNVLPATYTPDSMDGASTGAALVDSDMVYTTTKSDSEWVKMQKALIDNKKGEVKVDKTGSGFIFDWATHYAIEANNTGNKYFATHGDISTITQLGIDQREYDFGKYLDNPTEVVDLNGTNYCAATDIKALIDAGTYTPDTNGYDLELFAGLTNNQRAKTTVYLWIEGNDAECNNIVAAANFMAAFKFKGVMPTP